MLIKHVQDSSRGLVAVLLVVLGCGGGGGHDFQSDAQLPSQTQDAGPGQGADDSALPPNTQALALIDHASWHTYPASLDPLPSHQPNEIVCGRSGWYIERQLDAMPLLEVDTQLCNYTLLEHPSAHALAEGTQITLTLQHYDLLSAAPATAHVALFFGETLEWETHIDIPASAAVHTYTWRSSQTYPADTSIRLHLHNHGQNTWMFVSLVADAAL